ncbi:MAG: glycogen synthase [Candidatus Omnitrophota bacterium]|jgi:glycogen synthase
MKVLLLTNEYPPNIYGGAGVHIDYLSRELARLCAVEVRCFGSQKVPGPKLSVTGFSLPPSKGTSPKRLEPVFGAFQRCLDFNTAGIDAQIVHCHTWYTHLGGMLAKMSYGIPLVITVHSLEPLRPWKAEQLGGGYTATCWVERNALQMADAVIAVSRETKADIVRLFDIDEKKVHVIHNGIDPQEFRPVHDTEILKAHGIDPQKPYVLFVGRITRQKGIIHLVEAVRYMDKNFQVVLCAGAPDTPEIEAEMHSHVSRLQKERGGVVWIEKMLDTQVKIVFYSHAAVFCCPSVYEPFGIINLEAMACEVPVVASAIGGIKEVVVDGCTGMLVPLVQKKTSPFDPTNPGRFSKDLAKAINRLMADEPLRKKMGKAGRKRAEEFFSWSKIAGKTRDLYQSLVK